MAIGAYIRSVLTADAAVSAIVGTRVYPLVIPQNDSYPAVTYSVSTAPHTNVKMSQADIDKHTVRLQLWGNNYDVLHELNAAIRAVLDYSAGTSGGTFVVDVEFSGSEDGMDEKLEFFMIQTTYTFKEKRA